MSKAIRDPKQAQVQLSMTKEVIVLVTAGRALTSEGRSADCGGNESTASPSESLNILWNQNNKRAPSRTAQLEFRQQPQSYDSRTSLENYSYFYSMTVASLVSFPPSYFAASFSSCVSLVAERNKV